jgi:hypothetical protein
LFWFLAEMCSVRAPAACDRKSQTLLIRVNGFLCNAQLNLGCWNKWRAIRFFGVLEERMTALLKSIDAFCARLNAGMAAVAIVLTILVAAELTVRMPDFFQRAVQAETANLSASATPLNGSF